MYIECGTTIGEINLRRFVRGKQGKKGPTNLPQPVGIDIGASACLFLFCQAVLFLAIGVDKGLGGSTIASYICRALRLHWPLSIAEDLAFYLFVIIVAAKGTQVA